MAALDAIRRILRRIVLAGCGLAVAKALFLWLKVQRIRRMLAAVPTARYEGGPLLGCIPDMLRNVWRLHDWRADLSAGLPVSKYFGFFLDPGGVGLILRDPALVKHVLKDNFPNYSKQDARKEPIAYYFRQWLGDGMFTVLHGPAAPDGGDSWSKQRKIASGIFSRSNFNNNMHAVFLAKALEMRGVIADAADRGAPTDIQAHFFAFTMDSIMQIFFGEESRTLTGQSNAYAAAYDVAHNEFIKFLVGSLTYQKLTQVLPWPFGGVGGLLWRANEAVNPHYWKFTEACRTLDRESKRLVELCRADPRVSERKDLLGLFVAAEEKERFSTMFLRDVVLNFIIAGRDTTACALSWLVVILATNPEVQERLCQEIDEKLPDGAVPSFKSVAPGEMPYLNGVLYETLRLYPPVPWDFKVPAEDDVLPDGTPVPAGTEMVFLPYAMGRDASRYPEPERVRPERWIPFSAPPPHEFPVFQAGPRICLGMDMATFEAKLVVCVLLQQYTFELAPGEAEKIWYNQTITMSVCNSRKQDSHNLWVIPKRRR